MRKLIPFLFLIFSTLGAFAQGSCEVNTNFINVKYEQTADNVISLSWQYAPVVSTDVFHVHRYDKVNSEVEEQHLRTINATDPCEYKDYPEGEEPQNPEKQDPTSATVYSTSIYGMNLEGNIEYVFAIDVESKKSTGGTETTRIYIKYDGQTTQAVTSFECATTFTYAYGLSWQDPALTNKKSQSVTLNWLPYAAEGDYLYTVFGVAHNKVFATTSGTSAIINHLESGVTHEFQVRAYDAAGNYLATTPIVSYFPEPVLCLTFPDASASGNTVTLTILGYGNGDFSTEREAYTLINDDESVKCSSISLSGEFTFNFATINKEKEFRLETKKGDVKAVGLFKLDSNGALDTQYCDIIFDLEVTHVTQHTVKLEWDNPGFDPTEAELQYWSKGGEIKTVQIANPRAYVYELGGLEHSTQYTFMLKLSDQYKNQAKSNEVTVITKVGSICGMEGSTSGSSTLGCGNGKFLMPYDLEFYTAYRGDATEKEGPYVVIRFRPLGTEQINEVKLYATTEKGLIEDLFGITTQSMTKGEDGWYETRLEKYGLISKKNITEGLNIRFSVSVKHNKGCNKLLYNNTYFTKFVSYKVGVGCQDDEIFSIIKFEKVYDRQSEFTLQTNGRMASVGVFTEDGYLGGESFDLNKRVFYNNFDDAPSKFTLDISDYKVGVYYMHIHDVYGEAGDLKYLWAIY